jgi:hypothetical protein
MIGHHTKTLWLVVLPATIEMATSFKHIAMSFSIGELYDVNNRAAMRACNPECAGKLLREAFPDDPNSTTLDRLNLAASHYTKWAEGVGDLYVSTDVNTIRIEETDLSPGQYYKPHHGDGRGPHNKNKWLHFSDGRAAPGNVGGYHKAVVDTHQPGSTWTLSARVIGANVGPYELGPQPVFAAVARVDYAGFKSDPSSPNKDQCRNHLKIADLPPLVTGKFLFQDNNNLKENRVNSDREAFIAKAPTDGYFPIQLHRDKDGKIDLIYIPFFDL